MGTVKQNKPNTLNVNSTLPRTHINNSTVIARDPNMKVTTFSMGEETMLECHYKFGIYEEQRHEPKQTEPGDNPSTAQDFPV